MKENGVSSAFRDVPRTGVIYVMTEAARKGYTGGDPAWSNLGQGQPETGPLPDAPPRIDTVHILEEDQEYAPVPGLWELREAVASHYNAVYRRGMKSQYTAENVCISSGGRAALTRAAAGLGNVHLGHFLPDYTAYEELLEVFRAFTPIPILLEPHRGYDFSLNELQREILGRGLSALLLSNPCNPTGKLIGGESLRGWVSVAGKLGCTLLLDEFYSHYIWNDAILAESPGKVSAAMYVEDVEREPVVMFDGLTKNWRYPGWRVAWTVAPRDIIQTITSAGSFLDGGGSRPLQRAAIPLLEPATALGEARAIQRTFRKKRDLLISRLVSMGVTIDRVPDGTFYVWGNVRNLPSSVNTGMKLFRAGLDHQVICVPGEFFDVNPGKRRTGWPSRFRHHVRFSFGPAESTLIHGLERLEQLIANAPDDRSGHDALSD